MASSLGGMPEALTCRCRRSAAAPQRALPASPSSAPAPIRTAPAHSRLRSTAVWSWNFRDRTMVSSSGRPRSTGAWALRASPASWERGTAWPRRGGRGTADQLRAGRPLRGNSRWATRPCPFGRRLVTRPFPPPLPGVAEQILAPLPADRWSSIQPRTDVGSHLLAPPSYVVGDAYVAADPPDSRA